MESISPQRVRTAMCDQEGFYPFRSLLTGNLSSLDELALAERFARAVVLHDAMLLEGEPMHAPEEEYEWTEEQIAAGGRTVIVAFLPDTSKYGDLFVDNLGPDPLHGKKLDLSESLRDMAMEMSGTGPGDAYHDAQEQYLYRLTTTLRAGSSIVCGGHVGMALRERASRYPDALFAALDEDLKEFAREAHLAHVGVTVPAVLSIVLSRCQTREEILRRLLELRDEWRQPREAVWALIQALRNSSDAREMRTIQRELEQVSTVLSPSRPPAPIEPSRVLWELIANTVTIAGAFATGSGIAETVAVGRAAIAAGKELIQPSAKYIFGLGAIDFARHVRTDILVANKVPDLLDRFLTANERKVLSD